MSENGTMPEELDVQEPITDKPGPEPDLDEPDESAPEVGKDDWVVLPHKDVAGEDD